MAVANSPHANERVRDGSPSADVHAGDRLIWTQPDGAQIFIIVKRVNQDGVWADLRCHYGAHTWTRRHELPLFASMHRGHWTTADLLGTP